jgi:hypothetical protein
MMIKKVGSKYVLFSKKTGKRLSKPTTKAGAKKREKQVQYFKNNEKYKKDHGGKSIPIKKKKGK